MIRGIEAAGKNELFNESYKDFRRKENEEEFI